MDSIDIYALNLYDFTPVSHSIDTFIIRKAATYKSVKRRREYLASEWLRRFVLKNYIGNHNLVFDITDKGRPFLKYNTSYDFNISHTKEWIVIAIAKGQKIGIDIQSLDQAIDVLGIAKQYYAQIEHQWLSTLSTSKIKYYFYLLWTLKEASLKQTGEGIASGLTYYAFIYKDKKLKLCNTFTTKKLYYYHRNIAPNILLSLAATKPIVKIKNFIVTNNKVVHLPMTNNLLYKLK